MKKSGILIMAILACVLSADVLAGDECDGGCLVFAEPEESIGIIVHEINGDPFYWHNDVEFANTMGNLANGYGDYISDDFGDALERAVRVLITSNNRDK